MTRSHRDDQERLQLVLHAVWLLTETNASVVIRTQSPALLLSPLSSVSQEVNDLAPVTQTLSEPCYLLALAESENSMTHKTENWRVFSTSAHRAQSRGAAINRNNEAVMRSDWACVSGGTPSLTTTSSDSDGARLPVQTPHINTQRELLTSLQSFHCPSRHGEAGGRELFKSHGVKTGSCYFPHYGGKTSSVVSVPRGGEADKGCPGLIWRVLTLRWAAGHVVISGSKITSLCLNLTFQTWPDLT